MPLYEYECNACGRRFELLQRVGEPTPERCEVCGQEGVRKLLSSPAFRFKGSGWYVTDYAGRGGGNGGEKESASADAGDGAKDASKESGKTKKESGETGSAGDSGKDADAAS